MIVKSRSRLSDIKRKSGLVQSGLVFYFDAQDLSGADGAAITTLTDKTGLQTFTQGTASLRGVLKTGVAKGGKQALRFDATDDVYVSSAAASAWKFLHDGTGGLVHIAVKPTNAVVAAQELFSTGGWAGTNIGISIARTSAGNLVVTVTRGVSGQLPLSHNVASQSPVNTWRIYTVLFTSARCAIWLDETKVLDTTPAYTPSSSNPTSTAAVGLTSASYPFGRDLGAVAIYNAIPSDASISANIAALKARWV